MNHAARWNTVSALLVGACEKDRQLVHEIFYNLGWRLFEAPDRQRAVQFLRRHTINVVISDTDVPDWDWKMVLAELRGMEQPPQLIVTSHCADDYLWAEALNVGAYDVLSQPFDRSEVQRVIESAHRHLEARPNGAGQQTAAVSAAGCA